jgi:hypothetical protein
VKSFSELKLALDGMDGIVHFETVEGFVAVVGDEADVGLTTGL